MSSTLFTKWPAGGISSSILSSVMPRCNKWLTAPVINAPVLSILVKELALAGIASLMNLALLAREFGVPWALSAAAVFLPVLLPLRGIALMAFGVFRHSRRYAGVTDALVIAECVGTSSLAGYLICRIWDFGVAMPARVFLGDAVAVFLLLAGFHFGQRIFKSVHALLVGKAPDAKRVVIVGAGDAGATVVREFVEEPRRDMYPVAMIDDDPAKRGMRIHGVPVVGALTDLRETMLRLHASEVLVCIPSASRSQMQYILEACRHCGVPVRTLPALSELVRRSISSRDLRPVRVEDLLARKEISPDHSVSRALLEGKVVLVTGAGGSIGSELSKQIAAAGPRHLIVLDKSENNLFHSHTAIQRTWPLLKVTPVLADILDEHGIDELFANERPDIVFHAAAFKHVGMMELHPHQAIKNNVLGTARLLSAATKHGVAGFVNISTDKAVNPCNYMGVSKRLAEELVRDAAARNSLRFMNVRFGNVAGSSGSVLQLFYEQLGRGGPLRITDPQASRYFMSISEAVYLVLRAASLGHGGETFIFDMGKPVNIYELARTVSLFSGLSPEDEMPIEFVGMRDGEKVHEELWEPWERPQSTEHPQILALTGAAPRHLDIDIVMSKLTELLNAHDHDGLVEYLQYLAPNMTSQPTSELSWQELEMETVQECRS